MNTLSTKDKLIHSNPIHHKIDHIKIDAQVTHSQLFEGFKSESKYKTMEGGGVGACSLSDNTFRGRKACWSSGMGLGRVNKLHSLTRACTQPTQGG
jgi:hypothetical protein